MFFYKILHNNAESKIIQAHVQCTCTCIWRYTCTVKYIIETLYICMLTTKHCYVKHIDNSFERIAVTVGRIISLKNNDLVTAAK